MTLLELLDNPDYTNANTATKRAIFEKYSRDDENYTGANSATKAAIREKFGLGGVNVRETARLPEKVTDFSLGDWGNLLKQSLTEATDIINQGQRKPIVGPAVMAGVGELVKGAGAVGELATDRAQPITQAGQFLTESAKEVNPVSGTVGQVGSYIAPYNLAAKGIRAIAPTIGTVGEMAGSGAIVGGLTTPGSAEERLKEAATQAALGGGTVLALKGAGAAYQGAKNMGRGVMEGIENPTWASTSKTAFAPMGETYYPNAAVKPWQAMTPAERVAGLPTLEASQKPTAELFTTPTQKLARAFAEPSPTGGILVPHQGQVMQAFGEQTARDLINKPIQTAAANLAGPVLGGLIGGPAGALAGLAASPKIWKALDLVKLGKLSQTAALQPGFIQQVAQARATSALTPSNVPRLGYTPPAAGPVNPATMYVAPEGVAGSDINAVSQAGAMQKYAPQPVAAPVAAPVAPTPQAPRSMFANVGAEKKAEMDRLIAEITARKEAERKAAIEAARAPVPESTVRPMESAESRAAARAEARAETPLTTTEKLNKTVQSAYNQVAGQGKVLNKELIDQTLAGEGLPPVDWSKLGNDYKSLSVKEGRQVIKKFIKSETGLSGQGTRGPNRNTQMREANERIAAEEAALSAEEKAAKAAALDARLRALGNKYRPPGGTRFEMMTGESKAPTPQVFANEAEFRQQQMVDTLAGIPTEGTWEVGNKTIHSKGRGWPFNPTKVDIYATDTATGKRVPLGDKWTEADPKPSGVETAEKIRKKLGK